MEDPPPIIANDGHVVPHGTYTAYNRWKCRCVECRAENARKAQERRELKAQQEGRRLRPKVKGVPPHGTRSRYTSKKHHCDCQRCLDANRQYQAERQRLLRRGLTLKADWE